MFCELMMREAKVQRSAENGARSNRRSFLKCALASGAALGLSEFAEPAGAISSAAGEQKQDDSRFVVEAKFYQKQPNKKIKCKLCPRECVVGDKERGYCGVRENRGGTYYTLVHSRVCAAHVDPVEKKPLFHYLPGTTAFSHGHGGLQCELQILPELGYFAVAAGADSRRVCAAQAGGRDGEAI